MCRFIAALPFFNFAGFRFREDDREAERFERRFVFFRRALEEREARFFRRRGPPPSELLDMPGQPPLIQSLMLHLLPGDTCGADCSASSAASSGSRMSICELAPFDDGGASWSS